MEEKRRLLCKNNVLALVVVFILACAACFAGLFARSAAADGADSAEEEQAPAATLYIGAGGVDDVTANIYNYEFFEDGWKAAIERAAVAYAADSKAYVKVVLRRDWVADKEDGFGTDPTAFSNGRIYSPTNTNIVIDLNGKKIDRNLYDTDGKTNGHVLQVTGTLTVDDSVGGGKITGGNNVTASTAYGGGVSISNNGTFNLRGGSIENNKASGAEVMGVGVVVVNTGTFNMYGGSIKNHSAITTVANKIGAGVCLYSSGATAGTFNMYGGVIENNEAVYGGGVATYAAADAGAPIVNIDGGIIRNNKSIGVYSTPNSNDKKYGRKPVDGGGGGICANGAAQIYLKKGEICSNTSDSNGGGVYLYGTRSGVSAMYMSGGNIHDNICSSLERTVNGGGIAVFKSAKSPTTMNARLEMSGGIIEKNTVCGNNEIYIRGKDEAGNDIFGPNCQANGGAIFVDGQLKISGGEIRNNLSCSFRDGDTVGDLNDVCDGTATYGGAISLTDAKSDTVSLTEISDCNIHHNRAMSGGAVSVDGPVALTGGQIHDNSALYGGGLYLTAYARISVSGGFVVENNNSLNIIEDTANPSNLQIEAAGARALNIVGEFEDGARIHVYVAEKMIKDGTAFTQNYGLHNSKEVGGKTVYANPLRFFVSDTVYDNTHSSDQYIMVLTSGELGIATKPLKYTVTYDDGSTEDYTFGVKSDNMPEYNYVECTYGEGKRPVKISSDAEDSEEKTVDNAVGVYSLEVSPGIGNAKTEFSVVVKAKELTTADVDITLSDDGFAYDGTEKVPSLCQVKYGENTLVKDEDYTLSYVNNVNAGQATAVITFKGNYLGEARQGYSIATSSDPNKTMSVAWEVYNGTEWVALESSAYATTFTFDGKDQSGKLRAVLTVGALEQTIYADGVTVTDDKRNTSMSIAFTVGADTTAVSFKNAATYSVTVKGSGNYSIADSARKISGIVMQKQAVALTVQDFEKYEDSNGERQWMVEFKLDDGTVTTPLLDKATYIDPNATANKFGEKVTTGALNDAYARYRGTEIAVKLNGEYTLASGELLSKYLEIADSVVYSSVNKTTAANNTVGAYGQINEIETTVVITIGDNYTVSGGNRLELKKTWYIVTIGNNLRMSDGNEISATELTGWEFGSVEELKGYAFRPEHGDTVIYTYYKSGSTEAIRQFALRYADDTLRAAKEFYEVKTVDGKIVIDEEKPLNDINYLFTYNNTLKAGTYRIEISIPQLEPSSSEHTHWWNGSTADDLGTVYYEYTYSFSFTVATYSISDGSAPNLGINVTFPETTVYYNGNANNIAKPVVMLNRKVLVEGEDYTLSCEQVNVGSATLKITGINSMTGAFSVLNAFTIVKAQNSWKSVPTIMHWMYYGFDREINLLGATPTLLDDPQGLWFKITRDKAGNDVIAGLEHITLTDGLVSEDVESVLRALVAADYYLFAYVDATDNYYGLEPDYIPFRVFTATNSWATTPNVKTWVEGQYNKAQKPVQAAPKFGTAHVVIKGSDGKVYYDSEKNIDLLGTAKPGSYTLTASVKGTTDYSGLDVYTVTFKVFEKPGLPWWAVLLIVIGSLGLAALIIFILWKKGVFRIVTDKIILAIKTKVSVEATIASVRAAKRMEEGRQSVAEAKRRERIEQMRKKAEEQRALPPEERAARLEEKAKADEERAEKLRARGEAKRQRAAKMRGKTPDQVEQEAAATETEE